MGGHATNRRARDDNCGGVTLSGRFSSDHVEPSYSKAINVTKISGNDAGGRMTVAGHCLNCTALAKSVVDRTNKNQDFIWALGPPGRNPWTTALDGPLRRHAYYGYFQMDMTAAKGDALPTLGVATVNANTTPGESDSVTDHDWADWGHAFVMVLAFLIVFPGGVIALRIRDNVKLHMWVQSAGFALALVGLFSGLYISILYNRASSRPSTAQDAMRTRANKVLFAEQVLQHSAPARWHLPRAAHDRTVDRRVPAPPLLRP